jgi:uncharacterized protein YkwD
MKILKPYLPVLSALLIFNVCISQSTDHIDYYSLYTHVNFRSAALFNESIDLKSIDFDRIQAVIFFLTNEIRVKNKLEPLAYSLQLEKTARMHAEDMIKGKFFSHLNSLDAKKRSPNDRAELNNILNPFLAENIIEGYGLQYRSKETVYIRDKGKFSKTPDGEFLKVHTYLSFGESLLKGWMNSREHRVNILSRKALQLGCGVAYFENPDFNYMPSFKAVQDFQWYQLIK